MKKIVSRTLTAIRRAGFTAFGDPGRAAPTARKAATPFAARRAKTAPTIQEPPERCPAIGIDSRGGRGRYPESPVAGGGEGSAPRSLARGTGCSTGAHGAARGRLTLPPSRHVCPDVPTASARSSTPFPRGAFRSVVG